MKKIVSCQFNMDNCRVELKFSDSGVIAIDTIAVENQVADTMYQRSGTGTYTEINERQDPTYGTLP